MLNTFNKITDEIQSFKNRLPETIIQETLQKQRDILSEELQFKEEEMVDIKQQKLKKTINMLKRSKECILSGIEQLKKTLGERSEKSTPNEAIELETKKSTEKSTPNEAIELETKQSTEKSTPNEAIELETKQSTEKELETNLRSLREKQERLNTITEHLEKKEIELRKLEDNNITLEEKVAKITSENEKKCTSYDKYIKVANERSVAQRNYYQALDDITGYFRESSKQFIHS